MSCFPCFSSSRSKKDMDASSDSNPNPNNASKRIDNKSIKVDPQDIAAQNFNFRELATATKNFKQECLLGEGGFGRVYKGTLKASGQVVAVKQLDRHGMQENNEFLAEILALSKLHHPNLVNFIGYCADGDQRLLVYEFLPGGSVEEHLAKKTKEKPIDWITRMKIAYGAAQALEYLHTTPQPPIVYRDLKASSVLLDDDFNPKLSDIGLDKLGLFKGKMPAQSRMMGTYGYSAPEYTKGGQLTIKSDVYSFGVIFLELITGRRALDTTKPNEEQNLVSWAQPIFRDPKRYPDMADPQLKKLFPEKDLNQAVAIASMCLQEEDGARPLMSDVVTALSFLSMAADAMVPPAPVPAFSLKAEVSGTHGPHSDGSHSENGANGYSSHSSRTSHSSNDGKGQKSKKPHFSLSLKGSRKAISLALRGSKKSEDDMASGSSKSSGISDDEARPSVSSSDSSVSHLSRQSSSMLHRQTTKKSSGSSSFYLSRQSTRNSYVSDASGASQYESEEES